MRFVPLATRASKPGGGGGSDEDPRFPNIELRTHGVVALAFGFAFGLTIFITYLVLARTGTPYPGLTAFVKSGLKTGLIIFAGGFAFGTILAAIYNFLIFHRLNLFGIDRTLD